MNSYSKTKGWSWVPSLYFAEGLPYAFVMIVSVVLYKKLNISNTEIALYTSWLYLPWVIKPLWSPFVDIIKTKRYWIVLTQLVIGASLAGVALTIPTTNALQYTLVFFWLMAFSSSTHDIAADGFYMLGLSSHDQSWFIGIRNTFYRFAILFGQGIIVIIAGQLENITGNLKLAWSLVFGILSGLFIILAAYHKWALPRPKNDQEEFNTAKEDIVKEYFEIIKAYFKKPQILLIVLFILLYRFGEAQLVKIAPLFMLDSYESGGLGLSTSEYGFIYGTLGIAMLTLGGIVGGFFIAKNGLKYWIIWMALAMKLPDLVYVYMAYAQPDNMTLIGILVSIEQFGYGFGFTAYLLYMMMISDGNHKTAHYAICTGIMALGMMIPGMFSGAIQESVGYTSFFYWVMLSTIPGLILIKFISIDSNFGLNEDLKK
ncbi:MAG: MFS transporter [Candidatus Marinimicrobia bacterium]|nr:MFS transporter [Candidatus Neomarinimicrobiota bacterium]